MTFLVYATFPVMGYDKAPGWVDHLTEAFQPVDDVLVYNPRLSMDENDNINQGKLFQHLNTPVELSESLVDALQLQEELLPSLGLKKGTNALPDRGLASHITFRDLYILLRSQMVVVDANNQSFGSTGQEVLYGHLLKKPTFLVSDRYLNDPWMLTHSDLVVGSENVIRAVGTHLSAFTAALKKEADQDLDG